MTRCASDSVTGGTDDGEYLPGGPAGGCLTGGPLCQRAATRERRAWWQ